MKHNLSLLAILVVAILVLTSCNQENTKGVYDEKAISKLDAMAETIGNLNACSFSFNTREINMNNGAQEEVLATTDVYMNGPTKMHFFKRGKGIRRGVWFNNGQLSICLYNKQQHQTLQVPNTIISLIDSVHKKYDMDFPAADFFYPTITDDLIAMADTILFVGQEKIGREQCDVILAITPEAEFYIAINAETRLPKQLEVYTGQDASYVGTFTDWKVNPQLPKSMFEFAPPTNSKPAQIINPKAL